jgi:hypothetical protein
MSDIVHQHELHELVVALDRALEVLELCDLMETADGTGGSLLAVPLHHSHRIKHTINCAATLLDALRYRGRQP